MKKTRLIALVCTFVMMLSLVAVTADAAKVGDVVGYAQPTDIVATINGYQLESYNVNGYTYICVEDLRYYGFDVYYDNYSRTLSVSRNWGITSIDPQNTNPKFWSIGSNNSKKKILYTDIKTYVNGSYVASSNINGQTIIQFDHLKAFGAVSYDDSRREISLALDYMYYNPVALVAAEMHNDYSYNSDWKANIRAKGDVIMYIITARKNLNAATKNFYIESILPDEKTNARSLLNNLKNQGVPVSSIYFEARNSDGSYITSFQIN